MAPKKNDLDLEVQEVDTETSSADDVALRPGVNADSQASVERYISSQIRSRYEVYSYRHAAAILATAFPDEFREIVRALRKFRVTMKEIGTPGGNESDMPRKFSRVLRPKGWVETRLQGDLLVRAKECEKGPRVRRKTRKVKRPQGESRLIENFIDGHKIDYVKGRVAFDVEWNSKDQTFDRDLYALRVFHECGLISAGVLVTRSASLNPVFAVAPRFDKHGKIMKGKTVRAKYGASTTWMGKLLYRLNAGRNGGCPVLVFGITPKLISDWEDRGRGL